MADSRYIVFRWTKTEQAVVDKVRLQMKPLRRAGRWYTVKVGGTRLRVQFFASLPAWVYKLAGLADVLDSGSPVKISKADAERLFEIEGDSESRVDCLHMTVNEDGLFIGAYGHHCGTHYETRDLT